VPFLRHLQLECMDFRAVMRELQFGRPQVAVNSLARSPQLGDEMQFGLAADARLQPKLLHLQDQRDPLARKPARIAKTPHEVHEPWFNGNPGRRSVRSFKRKKPWIIGWPPSICTEFLYHMKFRKTCPVILGYAFARTCRMCSNE